MPEVLYNRTGYEKGLYVPINVQREYISREGVVIPTEYNEKQQEIFVKYEFLRLTNKHLKTSRVCDSSSYDYNACRTDPLFIEIYKESPYENVGLFYIPDSFADYWSIRIDEDDYSDTIYIHAHMPYYILGEAFYNKNITEDEFRALWEEIDNDRNRLIEEVEMHCDIRDSERGSGGGDSTGNGEGDVCIEFDDTYIDESKFLDCNGSEEEHVDQCIILIREAGAADSGAAG